MDKVEKIPENNFFAIRASVLLRGIGALMGYPSVSLAKYWKDYYEYALKNYPEGAEDDELLPYLGEGIEP